MKILSKLDSLDNIQDGNTRKLITKTTSSGSGNAVTAVSVSGDTITYTKGSTFLTGHQNAFSNVKVGSSTVAADQAGDTLELVAGDNVTLTPDTTNDKVTIAATFATKLTGTQANPIYLTSLESGQYLIQGYIKIDATHDFAIPVNCPYDTNCIIGYELFTICKNTNDGTMSVSCNYGNFLYDITGDNPVLLEEQMYASIDDIPTKTSDLTNDSNFVSISKLSGTESNPIIISSLNGGQYLIKGYIKLDSNTNFILEEGSAFDVQDIPNYILFEIKEDTVNHVKFVSCDYGHWIIEYTGSIWRIEQGSEFIDWDNLNYITDEILPETYYSISNPNGYTSNTGTITGIKVNGTSIATSGVADITVPTKTSDLTNDSGFITSDSDEKVKQTANTSSNSALRVLFAPNVLDTDYTGNVNKNSNFTYNPSTKALATGGTVDGYKLAAASAKAVDTSIAAASTSTNLPTSQAVAGFVEGKGYTSNTGTITGVSVNGTSVATSGVANITSVPASILSGAITNGVTATTQSSGDNSTKVATTAYVDGAIAALPEPMLFKGSVGTGGTVTWANLATAAAANEGWTYKVITDHTAETGKPAAKVGDTIISTGSEWVVIPSGDEPSGTVTSVTIKATSPITIDSESAITSSGTRTLSHANSGVTAGTYKSVTVNATGHVTGGTNPTTISDYGITDAKIASGVITLGSNTITPLTSSSTLDATKLSGTIPSGCYTDTKNTAGSTDSSSKLFLIGATSQAANPQTYSQDTAYIGTDGKLYSNSKEVVNLSDTQALTNKTYNGYTLAGASAKAVDTSISAGSSSANLPTSAAVATFVEGKGYTSNTGTITGVSINNTSIATSGVANITEIPTGILIPIATKTYTNIIGDSGANNEAGDAFYFGSITPASYTESWEVRYRVRAWVPSNTNYEAISEVYFTGAQSSINSYAIFNHIYSTSYKPCGYHCVHRLKQAGFTAGYGHAIGINLQDANSRDDTSLKRSITVEILSTKNCTVTLNDTAVKWASWSGTGTTNYNDIGNYNFSTNGLQETGDSNDIGILRSYYDRPLVGDATDLFPQNLCTYTSSDKVQPFVNSYSTGTTKTKNTSTFRIGAPIYFYASWTQKAKGSNYPPDSTMSLANNGISLQYSTNCGTTLTLNAPVYLVGIPNGSTYTLADTWWTQTLPSTDDGKIYIFLGYTYSNYQISWQPFHPIYWYKNGALQLYSGASQILYGTSDPSSSLGNNGDIYIKYTA